MQRLLLLFSTILLAGCLVQPLPSGASSTDGAVSTNERGWTSKAAMPTARSEMPVAVAGSKFYVPGGFLGLTSLEAYDPAADAWTELASLPQGRHHLMAAGHGDKIYVFGGAQETSWLPTNTTWIYDPSTDVWRESTPMPETRMSGAAASLDDFIYVVGGVGGTDALLRYDPATDTWERLAPLPRQREHLAAVALDGKLYVLGGRWTDVGTLATVDVYDPETDTWQNGPSMLEARSGFGATVVDGKIVVAGGELLDRQPWRALSSVEIYDPESGNWSLLPELSVGLHGFPLASADGRVYTIGGSVRAGGIENQGQVFVYPLP